MQSSSMTGWKEVLEKAVPQNHLLQFYREEPVLARNVALFLGEGANRGDWMIVIATPSHRELFVQLLDRQGVDSDGLVQSGRLVLLDAEATLAQFMVSGRPDWCGFDSAVQRRVGELKAKAGGHAVRAYGEMVDLLWKDGQLAAASQLEEFWNRLLRTHPIMLFCAYTVDILGKDVHVRDFQDILGAHSHLLPTRTNHELEPSIGRAMEEVLGRATVEALGPLIRATQYRRAVVPGAEATVLWIRSNLPPYAEEVLGRARLFYEAACRSEASMAGKVE
jgi:hypothetical protein